MANKDLNNDLFTGGSISDGEKETKKTKKPKKANAVNPKSKKKISANQIKIIKSVIAVVLVVGILAAYVGFGVVRKGFIHSTLQWTTAVTGITIKGEDGDKIHIPVSTYNYYFAQYYNNLRSTQEAYEASGLGALLGYNVDFDKAFSTQHTTNDDGEKITWDQYMQDEVVESIHHTYALYLQAIKDNEGKEPSITSSQQKEIDEALDSYREAGAKYGYTLSGYLVAAMGKGVTESVFRREATRAYIASNYEEEIEDEKVTVERTDEDYAEYKKAHESDLMAVNVRIFQAQSEEDAEDFKAELNEDGSNFTELAVKYAKDGFYKKYYEDESASTYLYATRANLTGSSSFDIGKADDGDYFGLDWLFSGNRKAGDSYQYEKCVVYVLSPAALPEIGTINIRHILIQPETKDDKTAITDATDDQWAAALKKANSIVDEFNAGKKTAEAFGKLAEKYTADDGSKKNGGLYEDVYPGQMIQTFNNWCFADGRNEGDVAIVKTTVGYHIMYFGGTNELPVWEKLVQNELPTEISLEESIIDSYDAKVSWFGSRYFEKDVDIDR
ncbi:MAG: peptidylprolyl isomerase [Eubacterium sp.]|nr:peptidylprolyl isomerase [Eubacterium sp.]